MPVGWLHTFNVLKWNSSRETKDIFNPDLQDSSREQNLWREREAFQRILQYMAKCRWIYILFDCRCNNLPDQRPNHKNNNQFCQGCGLFTSHLVGFVFVDKKKRLQNRPNLSPWCTLRVHAVFGQSVKWPWKWKLRLAYDCLAYWINEIPHWKYARNEIVEVKNSMVYILFLEFLLDDLLML